MSKKKIKITEDEISKSFSFDASVPSKDALYCPTSTKSLDSTLDCETSKKDESQSKKKEESSEDYMQAQKELQEAFENLFLPEDLEDHDTCIESLKTINDVLKQHKVDKEAIKNAFNGILRSQEYEKANPKAQLTKIKKIIGDTPNIDTEAAIDIILEEVMNLVPEGMSYFEFMKEYKLVAKPRVSFFAKLFGKK
jgi:hypothetical protein